MSSVIVEVATIDEVLPHPNADRLCLARIKGWQSVIRKEDDGSPQFKPGERVVYVPPQATVPRELAEKLGIVTYLSERTDARGDRRLVVKQVRLRGEASFGLLLRPADPSWTPGTDVREHYGIGKFEPPIKISAGDAEPEHARFLRYTDVENLRHFPDAFRPGEPVVLSEKIHGTNSRLGYVEGTLLAGSHRLQRRRPEGDDVATSLYWYPATVPPVMALLDELRASSEVVVLFGEVYGRVQSLHYGRAGGLGFAAFDLFVDGRYLDEPEMRALCARHGVETVPRIAEIPYALEAIAEHSRGKTVLGDDHIREGVVVRPLQERSDPRFGRLILKYVSDDYLLNDKLTAADTTDQ